MHAIQVTDLKKTYPGDVEALRGLSFTVEPGEIFALLGPNGAGKSTTVRILATLTETTDGEAFVVGHSVRDDPDAVRRAIGYVAQASGVDELATGRENLAFQARLLRVPGRQIGARVDEAVDTFGLGEVADRLVRTYSGGMKRRLDLAMGLIHRPRVLYLDEPTTGLDPESRRSLWEEVSRLARERNLTILLTTHYLEEADELADRLAIVDRGEIVVTGTPEDLKGRLRGDRVSVELTAEEDGALERGEATLRRLDGVLDVVRDAGVLHAQVERGAAAVPAVVAALEGAGLAVASVSMSRPSLDDVYLAATGHAYRENRTLEGDSGSGDDADPDTDERDADGLEAEPPTALPAAE